MITMEFEEMKKIWDTQNNRPLYVINEEVMHRSITSKLEYSSRKSSLTDFGLIFVALATATILMLTGEQGWYDYLASTIMILIAGYIWMGRIRRKKEEARFDRTMLGELDHAISNANFEVKRANTFAFWYLLPTAIPVIYNFIQGDVPFWKWIVIPGAFILGFALVRWELNRILIPRKKRLEALRQKLTEEMK